MYFGAGWSITGCSLGEDYLEGFTVSYNIPFEKRIEAVPQ